MTESEGPDGKEDRSTDGTLSTTRSSERTESTERAESQFDKEKEQPTLHGDEKEQDALYGTNEYECDTLLDTPIREELTEGLKGKKLEFLVAIRARTQLV